jgi:CRP-like cAMP-binding protein
VRLTKDRKVELIRKVPLFSHLSKKGLEEVARIADEIDFPEGKQLTKEGAVGREFLVILDGAADVRKNGVRINELSSGDFLGEIALITKQPRTATVTTTAPTRALVITSRDFLALLKRAPEVSEGVLEALGERLAPDLT